jgi:hypothetical protein
MAKSTKIPILLPGEYMNIDNHFSPDFVFKYLKEIGFYKFEFIELVNWNDDNQKIFEFQVNQLPDTISEIPPDIFLGALYMVTKELPELLTYESYCKIAIEKRGGFSINHKKIQRSNSEVMSYRDEVKNWIQEVLDEPYDDLDYEVRQSEYNMHVHKINQYAKSASKTSSEYITFLRPGSEIMQLLNTRVKDKVWPDEDQ